MQNAKCKMQNASGAKECGEQRGMLLAAHEAARGEVQATPVPARSNGDMLLLGQAPHVNLVQSREAGLTGL
jgi:hypothetical protein